MFVLMMLWMSVHGPFIPCQAMVRITDGCTVTTYYRCYLPDGSTVMTVGTQNNC